MTSLESHIAEKDHVIWDWNGTLLSDIDFAVEVVNRLLAEENLPPTTLETYKKEFGFPVLHYYERLGFNTEPRNFRQLCERFNDHFQSGLHRLQLWPGARDLLKRVKDLGKTQSLLSATEHGMLEESIRRFDVADLFDHVYGVFNKEATSKVDRGRQLMREVGHSPAATVLIGDTDHDLEVGKALGIDVILVEHGHQCPTRLREIHHRVVKVL